MSVENHLKSITQHDRLAFSKDKSDREDLVETFGQVLEEASGVWLVPCRHILRPPTTQEQIRLAEHELGYSLPNELRCLLLFTDGAELYKVSMAWVPDWVRDTTPDPGYVRYNIFSLSELVRINQEMLATFRSLVVNDPAYQNLQTLNYVAFCDVHDGNYLSILLEGPKEGAAFFLDGEYIFCPYNKTTREAYHIIAPSVVSWLKRVERTNGWGGFGKLIPSL